MLKRLICLANSRKRLGRCIAGRELLSPDVHGQWIRPVSDRANREVSEYERQYPDGSDPSVLDVVDVPLIRHCPEKYQSENWLLDSRRYWQKVGEFSWLNLGAMSDLRGPLWRNGSHTRHGNNDRVSETDAKFEPNSLKLIHIDDALLRVFAPHEDYGDPKRRVQARFEFDNTVYALRVTDPKIERSYLARANGCYGIGEAYLTLSLGEPFRGHCYKLVAAVILKP